MKRIHDSLQRVFQRHRLVFWYDATGEWAETFKAYPDAAVAKLLVTGNEFGTKVRIVRDPNPEAKFLIYVPTTRPVDADNWLLDLLLQGYEYKADKASLALQDVGLPHDFLHLAEDHAPYFTSAKRVDALRELIYKDKHLDIKGNQVEQTEGNFQMMVGNGAASDGGNRPMRARVVIDFPDPDSPINPTLSPTPMAKPISLTRGWPSGPPRGDTGRIERCSTWTNGVIGWPLSSGP